MDGVAQVEALDALARSNDGFRIAEIDLEIRGPGEMLGTRQSGLPDFRVANLVRDQSILIAAKREAEAWLQDDPQLAMVLVPTEDPDVDPDAVPTPPGHAPCLRTPNHDASLAPAARGARDAWSDCASHALAQTPPTSHGRPRRTPGRTC